MFKMATTSLTLLSLILLSLLLLRSAAQSSPAAAPGPAAPTDVFKILTKAGQYAVLIRLMRSTKVGDQINNELGGSNGELTFFAPTDNAFSGLASGTLNGLSDQQKVQLLQFHVVPSFISLTNFQTLSNPVQTQASDTYEYPLNVTTNGGQVNITTGVVNTTISGTVYSDGQLAIYQVDKVLQPLGIFAPRPQPPAPAPAPPKAKKKASSEESADDAASDSSGAKAGTVVGAVGTVVSLFACVFFL